MSLTHTITWTVFILSLVAIMDSTMAESFVPEESHVVIETKTLRDEKTGNGVIVSHQGHVLTAAHVVSKYRRIAVVHKGKRFPADAVYLSSNKDLALLKIKGDRIWKKANIGPVPASKSEVLISFLSVDSKNYRLRQLSSQIKMKGLNVYARSNESNDDLPIIYQGLVLNKRLRPGSSGGGVYNKKGDLVGIIITTVDKDNKNRVSMALAAEVIKPVLTLENEGSYMETKQKLAWFMDGLVIAFQTPRISQKRLTEIRDEITTRLINDNKNLPFEQLSALAWSSFKNKVNSHINKKP